MLSGAGISAESGVPTFRDDKNGLWAEFDPYELSSVQGWERRTCAPRRTAFVQPIMRPREFLDRP